MDSRDLGTKSFDGKEYEAMSARKSSSDDDTESSLTTLLGKEGGGKWMPPTSARSRRLGLVRAFVLGAVVLTSAAAVFYTAVTAHRIEGSLAAVTGVDYGDCGTLETVEEARALGCVFDPMSWVWTRPECYDGELVDDFLNRTDWSWHTDPKLTEQSKVPLESVMRGDHPRLFIHKKYHTIHCGYMMQKMQKALKGHPLDSYSMSSHHTEHCGLVLADPFLHEDTQCTPEMVCPTWVRATWTSCHKYT